MPHPYSNIPAYARWSRSVANVPLGSVNPAIGFPFKLSPRDKVATAGSCFAQNIAQCLRREGFNYFVTEDGHPLASAALNEKYNYGVYSARYANVYTPRQLVQLIERAFNNRPVFEDHWAMADGSFVDSLRPTIEPQGYSSLEELQADRGQHLAAVRRMFTELDYFVFTLGLTEAWVDEVDGTVFPVCPGVVGGTFDKSRYKLKNFNVTEVVADMRTSIDRILAVNSHARFILTVSPVPLIATAENQHVLVSTTYSKSVLRVACTEISNTFKGTVAYFPSYEIIVGSFNRGRYFADDLRSITEEGIDHVMRVFMESAAYTEGSVSPRVTAADDPGMGHSLEALQQRQRIVCEEELLDLARAMNTR